MSRSVRLSVSNELKYSVIIILVMLLVQSGLELKGHIICVAIYRDQSGALIVRYCQKKECICFVYNCSENVSIAITLEPLV